MAIVTKPEDKPKVIVLGVALVIVMVVIGYMMISAGAEEAEVVASVEQEELNLMLPPPTQVSGVMLLWSVERDAGPDPFRYVLGQPSSRSAPPQPSYTPPEFLPDERPVQPGAGKVEVTKSVVLKALIVNLAAPDRASALIEVEGTTSQYRIGQSIMPGVKITSITQDGITLEVNGEESTLGLNQSYIPGGL